MGTRRFDIRHRALVMGVLGGPDHLAEAEQLVGAGADLLDLGGSGCASGTAATEQEEIDRVVPTVEVLATRYGTPVVIDTSRAAVVRAAAGVGPVLARTTSPSAEPGFLAAAAAGGASVVVGDLRRRAAPVEAVHRDLAARAGVAVDAGLAREAVVVERTASSLEALGASGGLVDLGHPVLLSVPSELAGAGPGAVVAAHTVGITLGCRVLRASDVRAARRAAHVLGAVLEAREVRSG